MNKLSLQGEATRQKIMDFLLKNQVVICPVSYEEIREAAGLRSVSGVSIHLKTLEKQGRVKKPAGKYRFIQITQAPIQYHGEDLKINLASLSAPIKGLNGKKRKPKK